MKRSKFLKCLARSFLLIKVGLHRLFELVAPHAEVAKSDHVSKVGQ